MRRFQVLATPGWLAVVLAAGLLAACSSSDKSMDATGPAVSEQPPTVPATPMTAGDIMRTLSGNSFRYTRSGDRTRRFRATSYPHGA